jgi:hypothetical protein
LNTPTDPRKTRMEPYPLPEPVSDDFTATRAHFEQILTRLGDPEMMTCTEHAWRSTSPRPGGSCNAD